MTTTQTASDIAGQAYDAFEKRTRENGDSYVALRDDAPEWVQDAVRAAHGNMLPNDWRYETIRDAFGFIHDAGADDADDLDDLTHEFADDAVDVYTGDRVMWLASHHSRVGYCDDAAEELGAADMGIVDRIGLGQYAEASEVFGYVAEALREQLDES